MDPFARLIAGLGDAAPQAGFYGQLCETLCESVQLERAIIFQYDPELRRVQPLGAFGLDLSAFREVYVSPDTASFVRDALEQNDIVELAGDELLAQTPVAFRWLAEGRRVVCSPMVANGRWVGLVLADRSDDQPPLSAADRNRLLTLSKGVALATMARRATRKDERTRALRQRIDLAREVHDGVVQRLFGVTMALEGDGALPPEERARCAAEVHAAMVDLRSVVRGLGADDRPAPGGTFAEEFARWSAAHQDLELALLQETAGDVPAGLEGLAQSMLSEALRNARKHASPRRIEVRTRRDGGSLVIEVENDGVQAAERDGGVGAGAKGGREIAARGAGAGLGLRLLGIQALDAGGYLEFGAPGERSWQVRLVVPVPGA